jgi:UDP-N-acetylmuramoyl-tripeptide--D-alanyl-D-alanine ligase
VYCAGPLMEALWQALPPAQRGAHAADSAALEPIVIAGLRAGDALMVKGSLGSRMGPIVKALQQRFPLHAPEDASVQG